MRSKRNVIEDALIKGRWRPQEIAAFAGTHISTVYRHLRKMLADDQMFLVPDMTRKRGHLYVLRPSYSWGIKLRAQPKKAENFEGLGNFIRTGYMGAIVRTDNE